MAATAHVGSQALGEVHHRLVDVFWWKTFPDGLQGGFQLIGRLMLRLRIILLFQHGAPDVVQIWRGFNEQQRVRLQQVLHDARSAENLGFSSLKEHNFVIFIYILTKL